MITTNKETKRFAYGVLVSVPQGKHGRKVRKLVNNKARVLECYELGINIEDEIDDEFYVDIEYDEYTTVQEVWKIIIEKLRPILELNKCNIDEEKYHKFKSIGVVFNSYDEDSGYLLKDLLNKHQGYVTGFYLQ